MKNNIILESNNGRRFQLIVGDTGVLGTKEVSAPCRPGYEVKFLVAPDLVLNSDGSYKDEFKNLFTNFALKSTTRMSYYDTEDLSLNKAGWTIRIRKKSNKKAQQCTFKKRYPNINKTSVLKQSNVDKALNVALKDGFNTLNTRFGNGCEIDYGYSKATLSYSYDLDIATTGKGNVDIPNQEDSITFITANVPSDLKLPLEGIREHGAVELTSYSAMMDNVVEVAIESMTIKAAKNSEELETIIEVSFKLEDYAGEIIEGKSDLQLVNELRETLYNLLHDNGYLLEKDGLKTTAVLERY